MQVRRYPAFLCVGTLVPAAILVLASFGAGAQQIAIGTTRSLDFGQFVARSGGTIVLGVDGVRSRTGDVILLSSPKTASAGFSIRKSNNGAKDKAVIISLPADGSVRLSNGNSSMAVKAFVSTPSRVTTLSNVVTPLSIGATLIVAPNQAPGTYSGTFSVTVNFQ